MASKSPCASPKSCPTHKAAKLSEKVQASMKERIKRAAESPEAEVTVDLQKLAASAAGWANSMDNYFSHPSSFGGVEIDYGPHGISDFMYATLKPKGNGRFSTAIKMGPNVFALEPVLDKDNQFTFVLRTEIKFFKTDASGLDKILAHDHALADMKKALPGAKDVVTHFDGRTKVSFQADLRVSCLNATAEKLESAVRAYVTKAFPNVKVIG